MINYTYPKLLRKENPLDAANLCEVLSRVFEVEVKPEEVQISPVGGMSNKNFRVAYQGRDYVLRLPGVGSEAMVDRAHEQINSLLACDLGINPPIRYFDPATGVKLADFVSGAQSLGKATVQRHRRLGQVAEILRRLHHSSVRLSNDFNVFTELRKYQAVLAASSSSGAGMVKCLYDVHDLQARLNLLGVSLTPCHNDLVPENFITASDGSLYLIDWEYSGMNDPHWDLAALFLESQFSEEAQAYFLSSYYPEGLPPHTLEKILIYQILMDLLWSLWTDIKEAEGEDFGSYGRDRYARALANLARWREEYV